MEQETLVQKIGQFSDDLTLLHRAVHGTETETVLLGGVATPSLRKMAADLNARESSAAQTAIAAGVVAVQAIADTAAQHVEDETQLAVAAATEQAERAKGFADAAEALLPDALAQRVTDVEGVAAAAKTITDKATATPTAGGMPIAGTDKHLALGWFGSMLCNVRTVITVSGTFTAPVSGWYRIMCVGAGGAGGGAPIHGGLGGGTTSFGAYLSAIGGAGGSGNGRPGYYDACGGSGGGEAGKVTTALIYLAKDTSVTVTIGAGGVCSTTYNTMPTGTGAPVPAYDYYSSTRGAIGAKGAGNGTTSSYDATNGSHFNGIGGNGGRNGTGYGGGGGGAGSTRGTGGLGADGGADGAIGTSSSTVSVQGGTGGNGAVIVEYFDPAIAA